MYIYEPAVYNLAQYNCDNLVGGRSANLVTITSIEENNFIFDLSNGKANSDATNDIWIGISRNQNNDYVWASGSQTTYTNWNTANGQPSQLPANTCGKMDLADVDVRVLGKWATVGCDIPHPYVCQISASLTARTLSSLKKFSK
jgi:hypothetical protein